MTPNQLGDFYEGIAWKALESVYGSKLTYWGRKKKTAFAHTCGQLCEERKSCEKHLSSSSLIYTVPDFLIEDDDGPIVVHVCHWKSKETSHAKFWRTISELFELKCFVPNSRCLNIVFEASYKNGTYSSPGWYTEFLKAFHFLFDKTVFFDDPSLETDAANVDQLASISASSVFHAIGESPSSFAAPKRLASEIRAAQHPDASFAKELTTMWKWEREFCGTLPPFAGPSHQGEKLRNAMLQIILISTVFDLRAREVLDGLSDLVLGNGKSARAIRLSEISKLPVSNRDDNFQFCASVSTGIHGVMHFKLHEDLDWVVRSTRTGSLGVTTDQLIRGIERTARRFTLSPQVKEALAGIRLCLGSASGKDVSQWSAADWWTGYCSVSVSAEYNEIGELLLAGTGAGTYRIVSAVAAHFPSSSITRKDIRSFYSNKRSRNNLTKHKTLIHKILKTFEGQFDWDLARTRYLLRKTGRIVGPQSDINPLEELVAEILEGAEFADNCALVATPKSFSTLASAFAEGEDLGSWRVSACLTQSSSYIPIFLSGMKNVADCGHKTREFTGHLRMARYASDGRKIRRVTTPKYGLAILEGGYTAAEKRAFHMSGFYVVSISTLLSRLRELGIIL
jgi:hypothetical protein